LDSDGKAEEVVLLESTAVQAVPAGARKTRSPKLDEASASALVGAICGDKATHEVDYDTALSGYARLLAASLDDAPHCFIDSAPTLARSSSRSSSSVSMRHALSRRAENLQRHWSAPALDAWGSPESWSTRFRSGMLNAWNNLKSTCDGSTRNGGTSKARKKCKSSDESHRKRKFSDESNKKRKKRKSSDESVKKWNRSKESIAKVKSYRNGPLPKARTCKGCLRVFPAGFSPAWAFQNSQKMCIKYHNGIDTVIGPHRTTKTQPCINSKWANMLE
jgi:hypothetical protein